MEKSVTQEVSRGSKIPKERLEATKTMARSEWSLGPNAAARALKSARGGEGLLDLTTKEPLGELRWGGGVRFKAGFHGLRIK